MRNPLVLIAVTAALAGGACRNGAPTVSSSPVSPVALTPTVVSGSGHSADLAATISFSAERPSYERPHGVGYGVIEGLGEGAWSAQVCAGCHSEIAAEWQVSVHAQGWEDRQFQAEIQKSGNRWLCLNCHTPLLAQQDLWPVGLQSGDVDAPLLVENQRFSAALRDEGITCTGCHVRDGVIVGPGLGGDAPHAVRVDASLRAGDQCLSCHQAEAEYPGKSFVCTFQTGAEHAAGPYAAEGVGCVDCHMPTVKRPAADGGPVREVRRHWWRGAGIPKVEGRYPPAEALPYGLGLSARSGEDALLVTVANEHAGHRLPSGDPERFILVDVAFVDDAGVRVGDPWQLRIGQTWLWEVPPRKVDDNRLAPREQRTVSVAWPARAAAASIRASSHRMTPENRDYHALTDYPIAVQTHALTVSRK